MTGIKLEKILSLELEFINIVKRYTLFFLFIIIYPFEEKVFLFLNRLFFKSGNLKIRYPILSLMNKLPLELLNFIFKSSNRENLFPKTTKQTIP